MIIRIVLFLTSGILVSSNNGYPIIPAQTYPSYIQNEYANPSANQPSDIVSYLQGMMVQNQSPSLNLSPSNIRQILLNRILSNQQMQSNFDHNSKAWGSNFVELPNNSFAPNAVNSYSVAPMVNEYVNYQQTGTNKEDKAVEIKTEEKRKKSKKRKSKSRRKHDESEKNHNSTRKNNKVNDLQDHDRETSKKSKKRSRKPKIDDSSHDNHTNNENKRNTKKKKRKSKENEVKDPVDEDDYVENPKPQRRHKKKLKSDKENAEIFVSEQATTLKPTQIQEGINVAHFNEGIVQENRIPRNPILEGNDLFKSIPNLPENFANSFHFNGMSQFNNNPAMTNFFANYENIYQTMMAKNKGPNEQKEIKKRRPQKSRNNIKRKIEVRKRNSTATEATVSKSPKPVVTPKVNIVTTEKTIFINEKTRSNIDPIPKEESLKSDDKPTEMKETVHEIENEEVKHMESNIDDPVSNYGYIADYYPQFTDSAAYTANNKEVYIKKLGDTKYYYAVDKENPKLIDRMRFEGFGLPERTVKDYEVNKKYDHAEKEDKENSSKSNFKEIKEDMIQFRSAPQLEIPDFQTRKVEKSEINPDPYHYFDENDDYDVRYLRDKASIYSEAKLPYYAGTKENSKNILKDTRKDVETVFARSKVANYGPVFNPEEDSASVGTSNQDLTDDSSFKDGGTTYVLATSLDYPESFW